MKDPAVSAVLTYIITQLTTLKNEGLNSARLI